MSKLDYPVLPATNTSSSAHWISIDGENMKCLCLDGHKHEHVLRQESKRRYIACEPNTECKECNSGEIDCFIYWEISNEVAIELTQQQ